MKGVEIKDKAAYLEELEKINDKSMYEIIEIQEKKEKMLLISAVVFIIITIMLILGKCVIGLLGSLGAGSIMVLNFFSFCTTLLATMSIWLVVWDKIKISKYMTGTSLEELREIKDKQVQKN